MKIAIFNQHITDAAKQSGVSRIEILKQLRKKGVTGLEYGIQELEDVEVTKKRTNRSRNGNCFYLSTLSL